MVMVNTTLKEMNAILRKSLSRKDYEELCLRYGIDLEGGGEYLNFDMSSDRVELSSKYSVAFLLGQLLGIKVHRSETVSSKSADITINSTYRPFVNVLYVKLDGRLGERMADLLMIQEKLDKVAGRDRKLAAIGMFDYSMIKFPIKYLEVKTEDVSFAPLGSDEEKTYKQILEDTEKGRQYGHLLDDKPIVWRQEDGKIFALPPVINAGFASLTEDTKSILVDITGTDHDSVNSLTKALMFNLQFFGAVSVMKPKYSNANITTNLKFKATSFVLSENEASRLLGVELSLKDIKSILSSLDYAVESAADGLAVTPPYYRQDITHQVDIVDDIMRVYGVDKIKADDNRVYTSGKFLQNAQAIELMRDVLIGFGYQELDLNIFTNEMYQFKKTGIDPSNYASFLGTKSAESTMARLNITPEALRFVSNNLHKRFPQKLFDIGFVVSKADTDVDFANKLRLCILSCGADTNISEIVVMLEKIINEAVGAGKVRLSDEKDLDGLSKMVIKGRGGVVYYGDVNIGALGEVHPRVLNEFGIELPVAFAEIHLDGLGL